MRTDRWRLLQLYIHNLANNEQRRENACGLQASREEMFMMQFTDSILLGTSYNTTICFWSVFFLFQHSGLHLKFLTSRIMLSEDTK